mgnify:CR=1 FL=1
MPTGILSEAYTASAQREARERQPAYFSQLLGEIRLDALISRQVVIPDTHLFDGAWFIESTSSELWRNLGAPSVAGYGSIIEIRSRRDSLTDSLGVFFQRADSDFLNPFPLNFLPGEEERDAVAKRLGQTPRSDLVDELARNESVAKAVGATLAKVLSEANVDVDVVWQLVDAWESMLHAERMGHLTTRRWQGDLDLIHSTSVDPIGLHEFTTPGGRDLYLGILRVVNAKSTYRSDVIGMISSALREAPDDASIAEISAVGDWYSHARGRAMAAQHQVSFGRRVDADRGLEAGYRRLAYDLTGRELHVAEASKDVQPTADLLAALSAMSGTEFGDLQVRLGPELDLWWMRRDRESLRTLIQCIDRYVPATSREGSELSLVKLVVSAPAAGVGGALLGPWGAAAGALMGGLVGPVHSRLKRANRIARIVEYFWPPIDGPQP